MDDSVVFARWCQCAIPCGHIRATWRTRLNSCFLRLTRVHNTKGKSIGAAVSAQLTAESPYIYSGRPFAPKLPVIWGIWTPIIFMIPWASPSPQSKRHHDRFSCFRTDNCRVSLYFTMGTPFLKNCPFPPGNMDLSSNT